MVVPNVTGARRRSLTMVSVLPSGMRWRITIFSLLLGLLFPCICHSQTSVDALRGSSDAAQGVFDRISGNATTKADTDTVYAEGRAQVQPQFPGGLAAMNAYLRSNIHYPEKEMKAGIQGKVLVEFVVWKDGSVRRVKLRQGANRNLDAEAIRAIKAMPSWSPGSLDGKKVNVRFTLPIVFSIPEPEPPSKD